MDKHRIFGGLAAAVFVLLWGAPRLVAVLLSEPPPTRSRKVKAILNAMAAMGLGGMLGVLSHGWAAAFINGVALKFIGVDPHVDPTVASVVVAVLVTGLGPAFLDRAERLVGKKIDEVTS